MAPCCYIRLKYSFAHDVLGGRASFSVLMQGLLTLRGPERQRVTRVRVNSVRLSRSFAYDFELTRDSS